MPSCHSLQDCRSKHFAVLLTLEILTSSKKLSLSQDGRE